MSAYILRAPIVLLQAATHFKIQLKKLNSNNIAFFLLFSGETEETLTSVAVDAIDANAAVLTRIIDAIVDISLAVLSSEATRARAPFYLS